MILHADALRVKSAPPAYEGNRGNPAIIHGPAVFNTLCQSILARAKSAGRFTQCKGEDVATLLPGERDALIVAWELQCGRNLPHPAISFTVGKYHVSNSQVGHAKRAYLSAPTPKHSLAEKKADDLHEATVLENRAIMLKKTWGAA